MHKNTELDSLKVEAQKLREENIRLRADVQNARLLMEETLKRLEQTLGTQSSTISKRLATQIGRCVECGEMVSVHEPCCNSPVDFEGCLVSVHYEKDSTTKFVSPSLGSAGIINKNGTTQTKDPCSS